MRNKSYYVKPLRFCGCAPSALNTNLIRSDKNENERRATNAKLTVQVFYCCVTDLISLKMTINFFLSLKVSMDQKSRKGWAGQLWLRVCHGGRIRWWLKLKLQDSWSIWELSGPLSPGSLRSPCDLHLG